MIIQIEFDKKTYLNFTIPSISSFKRFKFNNINAFNETRNDVIVLSDAVPLPFAKSISRLRRFPTSCTGLSKKKKNQFNY